MTAFAEQFQRNGVHPRDVEFDVAIAKYLNSGGEISGALRRLELAARRMSGEGQITAVASSDRMVTARPRQPVEGERGQTCSAQAATVTMPLSSSSYRGGSDRNSVARKLGLPTSVIPVREPTQAFRRASVAAGKVLAITVLDTLKIDGVAVGDWSVARARIEAKRKSREGYILREASRVVANAPDGALLRNVVKVEEMQRIVQRAAEVADEQ